MYLIGIDLDGTLLSSNGTVSSYTKEMIKKVQKAGHKIIIATGRHPLLTIPILKELGLKDAFVCFNGAYIHLLTDKLPITSSYHPYYLERLLPFLQEREYKFVFGTERRYYLYAKFAKHLEHLSHLPVPIHLIESIDEMKEPILKTSIIGKESELIELEEEVQSMAKELTIFRSAAESMDIIHPNASKGKAIAYLGDYYKIDRSKMIAFGNYFNDVDMLSYVPIGVAMDNAPDYLKLSSSYVTKTNDQDGVAYFLEKFLLDSEGGGQKFLASCSSRKKSLLSNGRGTVV
ncbi:Cof subfamily protein (haloacid dehalogenase superfamily) [Natronobacillus azotifigens]|uniref:Cof-type HAD-IIB family hydrolase n=1 Tax=Natronobacillus azotifigens TaxID=472978 RepID=A0A9J6R9E3_9BACI|nr:Cof-type HAD-IIB family hydrolase [Natronobacillus azotifigens]MCZ0702298.1 Cof-type HAD-IIB family hydrolase [Natronobacillus azotifigens]